MLTNVPPEALSGPQGRRAVLRLPHLPVFRCCVRAVSTLVTILGTLALRGVALAPVTDSDLAKLETLVLRSWWGATRLSRAKEMVFSVLAPGHQISPVMHVRYERIVWLARVARCREVTQVLVQAICECRPRRPADGPVGRALHMLRALGCHPQEGLCWGAFMGGGGARNLIGPFSPPLVLCA